MSSDPALAVLATRIRIALMRHTHQSVDAATMVADTNYAVEVMGLCRASSESTLSDLADQFEALLRRAGRALPGARPPGPQPTRFDTQREGHTSAPTGATAPTVRSMPTQAPSPPATSAATAADDKPDDPNDPRNKRYIRGAR